MFHSSYLAQINKLPRKYDSSNIKIKQKFQDFFDSFGHGLVLSFSEGGEVVFNLINRDCNNNVKHCAQLALGSSAQETLTFLRDQAQIDSGHAHEIVFRGGKEKLHSIETINEWKQSLEESPIPIVGKVEEEIMFHHDLLRKLGWVSHAKERSRALEQAFKDHNSDILESQF